jgi:hypothetical protein
MHFSGLKNVQVGSGSGRTCYQMAFGSVIQDYGYPCPDPKNYSSDFPTTLLLKFTVSLLCFDPKF